MNEPVWIEFQTVLAIHNRQLAEHGGSTGIRDTGLLESALEKPKNRHHYEPDCDLALLAGSYAAGISHNHPFVDGNKRTAYVVMRMFLIRNGFDLDADLGEKYLAIYQLAASEISEDEFGTWLRARPVER